MIPPEPNLITEHRMRSLMCVASVLVLLAVAGWVSHPAGAASDDETPTIKKIMQTLHKGAKAPLNTVKASLKGDSPDWSQIEKDAEIIAKYGAFLTKGEPPKGEKADFEQLAKAYERSAKSLKTAAEKEDLKSARSASKKLGDSCKACHAAHKGG